MTIEQPTTASHESTLRLGQRLRRARLTRNLTQGEVAKNQFSVSYVSAVERGQIRPSLGALEKLAERLQVPITDLLSEGEFETRYMGPTSEYRETVAERHREEVEATLRQAQILSRQHKSAEAIDLLLRLSNQHLTPRDIATLQWHLAYCYIDQERGEEARRVAQEGIPLAERAGERELAERLRNELGNAYSLLHSHAVALDQYRACLRAIEDNVVRDPAFKVNVLFNIGNQHWYLAEYDDAIQYLHQAAEAAQDVIRPETLGAIYWSLSLALGNKGDTAGAKSYALRSIAAYEEAANRQMVTAVYNRLGNAYAQSGQVDEALAQLNSAYAIASGQQDARSLAEVQRSRALIYLNEKRTNEAAQAADEAIASAERLDDPVQQATSMLVLARVQEAQKHPREATASFEKAIEVLQSVESPEHLRDAYAQFSEFLERQGESKRAFEMLKQAYKVAPHS